MAQTSLATAGRLAPLSLPRRDRPRLLDATQLLEADHRRIERLLHKFERCRSRERKALLCERICALVFLHATLEEEIFLPAFLAATGQEVLHRQVEASHRTCMHMVAQVDCTEVTDELFDARVQVLAEVIRNDIREKEMPGGMFDVARRSGMALMELGSRLRSRKYRLERGQASPRSRRHAARPRLRLVRHTAPSGVRGPA